MSNKYRKIIALIVAILLVGGIVWYRMPIHKEFTLSVCSTEGEQVDMIMDVSWHRFLFAPTELRGTITIGDTVYQSLYDGLSIDRGSFKERLTEKMEYGMTTPWFNTGYTDQDGEILFFHVDENFETVGVIIGKRYSSDELPIYYGPATTVGEVNTILDEMSETYAAE